MPGGAALRLHWWTDNHMEPVLERLFSSRVPNHRDELKMVTNL